jgi:cytochrome c oxidase cbb3-type subunit III
MISRGILAILLIAAFGAIACQHEDRILRVPPSSAATLNAVQVSAINPGNNPTSPPATPGIYGESAYAVAEGQKLYEQYNCVGCHAHGGGGMGPALMDDYWIYGSEPQNIFTTVMEGRPNGMPSFRNRIPEYQVWEIAAYVRSLSGLLPKYVSPSRSDEMSVKPAESSTPKQTPKGITGRPGEQP